MIDRYTIKFGPAVSQKELEKAFNNATMDLKNIDLGKIRVRIDFVGTLEDLKKVSESVKELVMKATE